MSEEVPQIALVVEATADATTAHALIDRTLCEVDWIDASVVEHLRRFESPELPILFWKQIPKLCREHGVRAHGKFGGESGAADARAGRRALLLLERLGAPAAAVFMRDADAQPERLAGLRQARAHGSSGLSAQRVAIGVAVPEREAWHLCGFEPESAAEREQLADERKRLGFDPTRAPHELRGEGKRSAKRALDALCGESGEREERCLQVPLSRLRERGQACGLTDFLDELEARITPVIAQR